jgi:hypothetical protein
MPPRRKQNPPEAEPKRLTMDDIESGIRKLKRRIDEVKALDSTKVRFDDARVETATRNIRAGILEIFGPNSPENDAHARHCSCPALHRVSAGFWRT